MRLGAPPLISIRPTREGDQNAICQILVESGVFSEEEIEIAQELIDIYLHNGEQQDYVIFTAVDEREVVVGYYCIGPTPLTDGTFDLYWIAVKPSSHGLGIGRQLLQHAEDLVRTRGGRLVVAETSSTPKYDTTRAFYIRNRYVEVSRIKDYYRIGDDLVVYGKYLPQHRRT